MICEEIRFTRTALILPLHTPNAYMKVQETQDLLTIGESLVGWLGQSRSFYTLLATNPSFQYPDTFRVMPLRVMEEGIPREDRPLDNTLLVFPRLEVDDSRLTLSQPTVEVIRRLLAPLYTDVQDWDFYLGRGMRDIVDPFLDVAANPTTQDTILTNLANTVVRLGGADQHRWKFCCILTPDYAYLPFQKRSLVVRAKSRYAPSIYKLGTTAVSPTDSVISISLRAYQGGRIIYHHRVTPQDRAIANREQEEPGSAIAIPIGGEDDLPMGVLYVAADRSRWLQRQGSARAAHRRADGPGVALDLSRPPTSLTEVSLPTQNSRHCRPNLRRIRLRDRLYLRRRVSPAGHPRHEEL